MTVKCYADASGAYLGSFSGVDPPEGAIETTSTPERADMRWNGESWVAPPIALEQIFETARQLVNAHIDQAAQAWGYNDAVACASYVQSTNATWAAEATAFIAWRDACWAHVFDLRAKALAGEITAFPTADELIASLPAIVRTA